VRYGYTGIPTYALNSSGTLVQVGTITELTSTSECSSGTAPSCVGTSAELLTTRTYGVGNYNGLLTTETKGAGTGSWALNLATSYYYTPQGDTSNIYDPRGNMEYLVYDVLRRKQYDGHLTGNTTPWLSFSAYSYDGDSDLIQEARATAFDPVTYAPTGWQYWQTTYTPTHKVKTEIDPTGYVTTFTYDTLDRLSTVTDPTQPTGYVTNYTYNKDSTKYQEQRAYGTPLQENYATFTYTPNGKVQSETDARGNAINYTYDGFDRLATATYADGTSETNAYDPNSAITIWTNRANLSQIRCYDALGRKIAEKSITGATNAPPTSQGVCPTGGTENQATNWYDFYDRSFSYDLAGRMLTASTTGGGGWTRTLTYDAASRPWTLTDGFGTFTYGYDAADNLASIQYPTGHVVGYQYDDLDRMTCASLDGNCTNLTGNVVQLSWDTLSRRKSTVYGDTSSATYVYDGADRLQTLSHAFPNEVGANVTFGFTYGDHVRLTSRTTSNTGFNYTVPVSPQTYVAANALNQYPTVNSVSRTYWPTGALGNDGVLTRWYDQAGALAYAASDSTTEWTYTRTDALGRPYVRSHNNPNPPTAPVNNDFYYSYGPLRPEVVLDRTYTYPPSGSPYTYVGDRIYVLGPSPDERLAFEDIDGKVYYPHADRQGSTISLARNGFNVQPFAYDAYGLPQSAGGYTEIGPGPLAYPYLYTGQRFDPFLQAYDYKARIYSALDGRFWQPDGIGPKDDINLYSYTYNSPLDGADPSGNCASIFACKDDAHNPTHRETTVGGSDPGPGAKPHVGTATAAGGVAGVGVGVAASAGCDAATVGACVPADPAIIGLSGGIGAAVGGVIDNSAAMTSAINSAMASAESTISEIVVHGNSLSSSQPTYLYQLTYRRSGAIAKFGITSNPRPQGRYPDWFYGVSQTKMDILAKYPDRRSARDSEIAHFVAYVIEHNGLPPPLSAVP